MEALWLGTQNVIPFVGFYATRVQLEMWFLELGRAYGILFMTEIETDFVIEL